MFQLRIDIWKEMDVRAQLILKFIDCHTTYLDWAIVVSIYCSPGQTISSFNSNQNHLESVSFYFTKKNPQKPFFTQYLLKPLSQIQQKNI